MEPQNLQDDCISLLCKNRWSMDRTNRRCTELDQTSLNTDLRHFDTSVTVVGGYFQIIYFHIKSSDEQLLIQ